MMRRLITVIVLGCLGEPLLTTVDLAASEAIHLLGMNPNNLNLGLLAPVQAQTVPAQVRRGYALLSQGLVNDAINTFRQAIRAYPQSLEAKLGLGIAYRRAGKDAEALQAYEQALQQAPNNQLALKSIGTLGSYRPEWQPRGIQALTTLLNLNPSDAEARAQRALLYGYQGRFAESLADYQIVLQNNPAPDAVLGAAQIYTYTGNYQQGLQLFNRYLATGKAIDGYAAIAYARALRETGNPSAAVRLLEAQAFKSKQLDDRTIQIRAELAQAYLANQQSAQALAVLDPLRGRRDAILPLARSLNEIGRRANQPGLSQEAAALYKQALAQTTNPSPTLVREIADVLSGVPSERQLSLQLYRQLAASQPNDPSLLLQQLALENQLGLISPNDLKQRLRVALQTIPNSPAQQQLIAQALVKIDPPEPEFLPIYQSLLSTGVNQPFLNFRIAQILIARNDFAGARTALAAYTATTAGSRDQAPELLLADIERREGNLEASAQRYQNLISSNPTDKDIFNGALRGLAGVRITQGRADDAIALYDRLIALNPQDLTIQLGRTSVAYQSRRISQAQAEAVLNNWLATQPANSTPPELFSLVATLPANPQRESLYKSLLEADPNNIPIQLRSLQLLAARNPGLAKARVAQLIARDPNNLGGYFLQAEVAQATGDLELASRAYQTILGRQPENTDALAALGGVRFRQRQYTAAEELYSQVLTLKPDDRVARRSLAGLVAVQDRPQEALRQLEQLQVEQLETGSTDVELSRQRQRLEEDFLRRRGFQPPWERY